MLIDTRAASLPLTLHHLARLDGARNTRLTCVSGLAWITIDNDPRDIVLEPGQEHVVDSDGTVVVYPLRAGRPLELQIDASGVRGTRAQRMSVSL